MDAFEEIKHELVHELGDKANKTLSRKKLAEYVGKRRIESRFEVFAKRNKSLINTSNSITYADFLACVLLSGKQEKHNIISSIEENLGKMEGDLKYFEPIGEEIAKNLDYDPLAGMVGSLRKPGSEFYDIKDGKAGLEALINSPVSARGKNSGYRLGNQDPVFEFNYDNPPDVYFNGKKYPVTGLFLEPETPRLYLASGNVYFSETSLNINREITAKEISRPENIINLKHLNNGSTAAAFNLIYDGLELFINNIGMKKTFPGYDFTGIKYLF